MKMGHEAIKEEVEVVLITTAKQGNRVSFQSRV